VTGSTASPPSHARSASHAHLAGWLLALGALLGAISGVCAARDGALALAALPSGVAALVDGVPILAGEHARAVEMLASDRREKLAPGERARVLERLIDEQLLVASALAQGLLASERSVRDAVTSAMVESVVAESASRAPTQDELRASYDAAREATGAAAREATGAAAREAAGAGAPAEPFEAVRDGLAALISQRARDAALRSYLAELRERARIGCGDGAQP
jgi:hypothetical protein